MEYNFLMILLDAIMVFFAGLIYIFPLRKKEKWITWLPVMLMLCVATMWANYWGEGIWAVATHLALYLVLYLMMICCTKLSVMGSLYCAIWAFVTSEAVYELWLTFKSIALEAKITDTMNTTGLLCFTAVCYLLLAKTVARSMPQGDIYQIGPRQLTSAYLLGGMFVTMSYYFMLPDNRNSVLSLIFALCQIYCISLLYLQTELFKKSKMEKDLAALNFLYSCEQQQYAAARQNVRAVNRKCEELEQLIDKIQHYLPEDMRQEARKSIVDAMKACDTVVKSGNDVLDIVLTEKRMLAEASDIRIDCIADGKLLDFMEVVDIYSLFSNALDNAIEAVASLPDYNHRLIDVLVHDAQNFLVIKITNPLRQSLEFEEDLPVTTKSRNSFHGYGLKVIRQAVEKYRGMISIETADGFFTLKVLIPLSQKER